MFPRWGFIQRPFAVVHEIPEFRRLWAANLVSAGGSNVTRLALPLTAAVTLAAGPAEMALLVAAGTLPNLVLGLPAGVLVDRLPRRPLLVAADVGRALLLASIPAAALVGLLRLELLYAVAFLAALLDLVFDLAAIGLTPLLLPRGRLMDGNTAMATNSQVAGVAGPAAAGALVGALGAPFAIVLDTLSFLASAALVGALRVVEPPSARSARTGWWAEGAEGLALVWRDPVLRAIVAGSVLGQIGGTLQAPLLILFLVRELGLEPATIGVVFAVSGVAAIPGGLLARPLAVLVGPGRAIAAATLGSAVALALVPLAGGPTPVAVAVLVVSRALFGVSVPIFSINHLTLRMLAVPAHLHGRANAVRRSLMFGGAALGALASGYLGEAVGLRPTLFAGALVMGLALVWEVCSPLWSLRDGPPGDVVPAR